MLIPETKNSSHKVQTYKIILPVIIGLSVVGFLFYREFSIDVFRQIHFTGMSVFWILMAFICLIIKDFAYMARLRTLSGYRLSWLQSFRVIILWEFTSAITPAVVGGASVSMLFIYKEGIGMGKSAAITMIASILDELYFLALIPLLLLLFDARQLFEMPSLPVAWIGSGLFGLTLLGYLAKLLWALLLAYGIFIHPRGFGILMYRIAHLPFLKRWKRKVAGVAGDIAKTSQEIRTKNMSFWLESCFSTFLSWTARYLVANCLFLAFFPVKEHLLLFSRQVVMFVALLFAPTPGGSGIAEITFNEFLAGFVPVAGFSVVLALLWRLVTYYPELILGILIFPKWLGDKFGK
ncbi:MAG: flippase-like domain-containing protein [Dysgonamonadaceae bacterium]|jgi:uncharacterized protein (TIRG00374 family)|nr:flippase-like domain-containing protein [Dysgonamonadaceae bacterium]